MAAALPWGWEPQADLVHAPLAHWARARAHACAVSDGRRHLSFADLHAQVQERAATLDGAAAPAVVLVDDRQTQLDQLLEFLAIVASGRCAAVGDPDWPPAQRAAARAGLGAQPAGPVEARPDSPFYIGFTSGSSGLPKGFCRNHQSWTASFRACLQTFGPAAALPLLVPGRLSHSLFLFGMLLGLWSGAGIVLQERFSASAALRYLADPGRSQSVGDADVGTRTGTHSDAGVSLVAVPSQLLVLLERAARQALAPMPALVLVMISGARWPRQHTAALQALFPGARIVEFYGASELSFVAWTAADARLAPEVVGQPFAGVDIAIRPLPPRADWTAPATLANTDVPGGDGAAQDAGAGAASPGLIWVRSGMLFSHYVGAAEADASACQRDGAWLSVGDVGYRDAQGRLCLLGRLQRMIVTQAKNLFPEELETVLEAHPQIARASVHGVPDGLRGAALVALILWEAAPQSQSQSQPPADAAALAAWCRARLQAYKTPRQWFVCTEWAWTGSGKTDHPALARRLQRQLAADRLAQAGGAVVSAEPAWLHRLQ